MKRLLLTTLLALLICSNALALINDEPDYTLLWSDFGSIMTIDSFAVTTTNEAVVVLAFSPTSLTYEPASYRFVENRPIRQKRSGNVITVQAEGNVLYFFDIGNLPEIELLGSVSFAEPFYDFALLGQDIYVCKGFSGLQRYSMVNFGSLTLADSSLIGIHYTTVDIIGNQLFALDDYNGIMRYHLSGIGFGTFLEYVYLPRRATTFTVIDSTLLVATYAPEILVAQLQPSGPVITDTLVLMFTPTRICAVDTLAIALSPGIDVAEIVNLNTMEHQPLLLESPLDDQLEGQAFAFYGENRFIAPSEAGGLEMYRLDRIPIDPTPTPVFARPGPVVDLFIQNNKLYTGGLANPVDIFTLDDDGAPISRQTVAEMMRSVQALHLTPDHIAVYFPALQNVNFFGYNESVIWSAGGVHMTRTNIDGIFFSEEKIDTVRQLLVWGTDFANIHNVWDNNHGAPPKTVSVVDRVLDAALIDTILYIATGKGKIQMHRVWHDSVKYRSEFNVTGQAYEINAMGNQLLAFSGQKLFVIDVSRPDSIPPPISVSLPVSVKASAIDGDRLVASGHDGFVLIDMSVSPPFVMDYCNRGGDIVATGNGLVAVSNGNYVFIYDTRGIPTGVDDPLTELPDRYVLTQNYPNPFNPTTTIDYSLPQRSRVKMCVYNILGRRVTTLVDSEVPAGTHTVEWNGTNDAGTRVASGVYLYRIETDDFAQSKKMILLK